MAANARLPACFDHTVSNLCNCSRFGAATIAESFTGTYGALIFHGGVIENATNTWTTSAFTTDIH